MPAPRILLLTLLAMLGFAGNSLLCRLALKEGALDAASFTSLRLLFGALTLGLLVRLGQRRLAGNWLSALALFLYAAAFSFAYLRLDTGTGALLLFGAVQVGMVGAGWRRGERLNRWQGMGFLLAVGGLLALLLPGASAPDLLGALRGLTAVQAGTVQLSVPILAALGGSLLLDEALSLRLALTALAVLGGIALMLRAKQA